MCVKTCVKISYKSDNKWRSYSLCKLSSCVTRGVYKSAIPLGQSYRLQRGGVGGGWGGCNGQMYCFFLWKLSTNAFPTEWCKANRITGQRCSSVTHETSWREVAQYVCSSQLIWAWLRRAISQNSTVRD